MSNNNNMNKAKKAKNDEFYTQLPDIEKEASLYKDQSKGKVVYCNCDNPEFSNFWKYFILNLKELGLKKLVATYYSTTEEVFRMDSWFDKDMQRFSRVKLKGNGDFRSPECIEILKEADIIVSNPPLVCFVVI